MDTFADEDAIRCLRYVAVLESSGYKGISTRTVDRFHAAKLPKRISDFTLMTSSFMEEGGMKGSMSDYLLDVGWLDRVQEGYSAVSLSHLGKVVLKAHSTVDVPYVSEQPDDFELVIRPEVPLDYAPIFERIASMTDALLVDAYFPAKALPFLDGVLSVARVLLKETGTELDGSWAKRRGSIANTLGLMSSPPEVRVVRGRQLHDRYVLPAKAAGLMLGGSMFGKQPSAVVRISEELTKAVRTSHEEVWASAEKLEPTAIATAE